MRIIDSIPIGIESILIFSFIFYYFYDSFTNIDINNSIAERSSFWFIVGVFVYLGSTFFVNILGNSLESEYLDKYFYFSYVGDIVKNILFAIAVLFLPSSYPVEKKLEKKKNTIPFLDMN